MTSENNDIEELATVIGEEFADTVNIGGETPLQIRPLKMRQLPAFARALQPALPKLAPLFADEDNGMEISDLVGVVGDHGDDLMDAVAIGASLDKDVIDDMDPDVFLELALVVLEVNMDFFAKRLLPKVGGQLETLTQQMEAAGTKQASA
jgi:hypothetical protein